MIQKRIPLPFRRRHGVLLSGFRCHVAHPAGFQMRPAGLMTSLGLGLPDRGINEVALRLNGQKYQPLIH